MNYYYTDILLTDNVHGFSSSPFTRQTNNRTPRVQKSWNIHRQRHISCFFITLWHFEHDTHQVMLRCTRTYDNNRRCNENRNISDILITMKLKYIRYINNYEIQSKSFKTDKFKKHSPKKLGWSLILYPNAPDPWSDPFDPWSRAFDPWSRPYFKAWSLIPYTMLRACNLGRENFLRRYLKRKGYDKVEYFVFK